MYLPAPAVLLTSCCRDVPSPASSSSPHPCQTRQRLTTSTDNRARADGECGRFFSPSSAATRNRRPWFCAAPGPGLSGSAGLRKQAAPWRQTLTPSACRRVRGCGTAPADSSAFTGTSPRVSAGAGGEAHLQQLRADQLLRTTRRFHEGLALPRGRRLSLLVVGELMREEDS